MPGELTLSGFQRVSRSIERTFRDAASELPNTDASTSDGRTKVATIAATIEISYKALLTSLDPYLQADELPDTITDDMVQDAYLLVLKQYSTLKARCDVLLSGVPHVAPSASSTRFSLGIDNSSEAANMSVKVPKFKLPSFSGDCREFDNFWSRFDTLINQSPKFTVIEKFEYLLDQLQGSAYKIVSHLDFKPENYLTAIRLLKDRYSNPRRAISLHSNGLLNLPKIDKSVNSIRTFLDEYNIHFHSLKNHSANVHVQDVVFSQFILSKFSPELRDMFETRVTTSSNLMCPSIEDLLKFLENYVTALENVNIGCSDSSSAQRSNKFKSNSSKSKLNKKQNSTFSSLASSVTSCLICNAADHDITKCSVLLGQLPRERYLLVKSKHLCTSCLSSAHKGNCNPKQKCNVCNSTGHHTLLHFGDSVVPSPSSTSQDSAQSKSVASSKSEEKVCLTSQSSGSISPQRMDILLATCLVKLEVSPTTYVVVRAILDSASHVSFISEHCAQMLKCNRSSIRNQIKGVGSVTTRSNGLTSLALSTLSNDKVADSHPFIILNKITSSTPRINISAEVRHHVKHLILADPTFDVSSPVDCLLGADLTATVLSGNVVKLGEGLPVAVHTLFGYVLMGTVPSTYDNMLATIDGCEEYDNCLACLAVDVDDKLLETVQNFWLTEEPPQCSDISPDDVYCENYFNETTVRLANGRYQVRLPFKNTSPDSLGDSYQPALLRLKSLERKFVRDPHFKDLYVNFMADYQRQGHMIPFYGPPKYIIPHHGIFKSGNTEKIRVVFDASAKTTSGLSLNDVLHTGQKLQTLVSDVMTLFRFFNFAFVCDIEQMFRQIIAHSDDQPYQCILWRESPDCPVQLFALTTVTYGTGPAPYLALRSLRQLAMDEQVKYPLASNLILRNSFVDDFQGGSDTISNAIQVRNELINMLTSAGFILKRWAANHDELVHDLPDTDKLTLNSDQSVNVLGLNWYTSRDTLKFPVEGMLSGGSVSLSKRIVLSQVARLYDPCGWMSPVVFRAKCFLQDLWRYSLDWDTPLPAELEKSWLNFMTLLVDLKNVEIFRPLCADTSCIQIHGFSDASQLGYAAALYLRVVGENQIMSRLIVSKTKVAPLKPVTIPRLELMASHLLARLFNHYCNLLKPVCHIDNAYLWTDSTIVLDWIKTPTHLLKTFVANRVSQIIDWTSPYTWHHISGNDNPADKGSRGLSPLELASDKLWWEGPPFLSENIDFLPSPEYPNLHSNHDLELKHPIVLVSTQEPNLFEHFSSWPKLIRSISCIVKWINLSKRITQDSLNSYQLAVKYVLRYTQRTSSLCVEIEKISKDKIASRAVQRLCPFIDEFGLLRARGRLANSTEFGSVFPIVLPKDHPVVTLLIRHYHIWLGHAGPGQVQSQLFLSYWILSARQVIRHVIHECVTCFRVHPRPNNPLMGDLPSCRVNPAPPLFLTGMDFCGPWSLKSSNLRKAPLIKAYLCIFICMCVKAIHMEVALDLSGEQFLDCLKRFISRRGAPNTLFSDCGTNFVGSRSLLQKQLKKVLHDSDTSKLVKDFALDNNIKFVFSCPSAPHQGGLMERAVQSTKFHLKRVIGQHVLSVPQFSSVVTQVEGILNSRPLSLLPGEPGDLKVLTPGHFLIGRPITAPPNEDLSLIKDGTLRHYQLTQAMLQRFWKRWSHEYLATLHSRSKWTTNTRNLCINDVVIMEEPNSPPFHWPLGIIVRVLPGTDGVVRRAVVKTNSGQYERPSVKLYRLPIQPSN